MTELEMNVQEVMDRLSELVGASVFFDDSRLWTLGYREDGVVYGVQRPYLGGGVRGGIRSNIKDEAIREAFTNGLKEIEGIINGDTEGLKSWEQNTGVLL